MSLAFLFAASPFDSKLAMIMLDVPITHRMVQIRSNGRRLQGDLLLPEDAHGLAIFAHGPGSNRGSARTQAVARRLQDIGYGTLLVDLLELAEQESRKTFETPILALRLRSAAEWCAADAATCNLPIAYFGANGAAAAAIAAAARQPDQVKAIVSGGGRPDLAWDDLALLQTPTLLLVGSKDAAALDLNRRAFEKMTCPRELLLVSGTTHHFSEPGALDEVAKLTARWFDRYLKP